MWVIEPLQTVDAAGKPTGRWRLTARSDEGGGGPYGDTSHDHSSAKGAEDCDRCDDFCSKLAGFPSKRSHAEQKEKEERAEYERLKAKFDPPPPPFAPSPIQSLEQQFQQLLERYPNATMTKVDREHGGHVVTVPDLPLPAGKYDRETLTVQFIVPAAYPLAEPQRFYSEEVHLTDGSFPSVTGLVNPNHLRHLGINPNFMCWGWIVQAWNPRRETLKSYVAVIKARLNLRADPVELPNED